SSTHSRAAPARSAGPIKLVRRSRAQPPWSTGSSTSRASTTGPTGSSPRADGFALNGRTASTHPSSPATGGSISSASAGSTRSPPSGRGSDPLGQRQLEGERCALVRIGLDPDPAVHRLNELPADVEPQTASSDAAPMVRIESIELLEDPLLLAERDAQPLVADGEACVASV